MPTTQRQALIILLTSNSLDILCAYSHGFFSQFASLPFLQDHDASILYILIEIMSAVQEAAASADGSSAASCAGCHHRGGRPSGVEGRGDGRGDGAVHRIARQRLPVKQRQGFSSGQVRLARRAQRPNQCKAS